MPDITLKYPQAEVEDFIRKMLAAKGLQPKGEVDFRPVMLNGNVETFNVFIDCEQGPLLDECPMCQSSLKNGAPVAQRTRPVKRPAKSAHREIQEESDAAFVAAAQEAEREYPVDDETQETQDPAVIDPELGETFDPPSPGEGVASVSVSKPVEEDEAEMGGSMKSLLSQNRRLTAQKEREAAERKRQGGGAGPMGAGESARPPKPGEGS